MKKPIKLAVLALIILASVAGGVYYMMMPVPVRMSEVVAQVAELTFTEQGVVTAENTVLVFPFTQGEVNGLYVREGQQVQAGDILLSVDDTALRLQLDQIQSGIRSLTAQLANVDVEDANMRQTLQTTRNSLQGELQAINAQATESDRAFASHSESIAEQKRVQQIVIDQHQNDLTRSRDNFNRIQTLYQSGVATRTELEAATASLTAAQTLLETAEGQLAVIAAGTPQNSAQHFEGIRASLNAQITGINQQLTTDTTTAARTHFSAMIAVEESRAAQIEREIENAQITAPMSGVITTLHAQNTNFISAATPVAEITAPGSKHIEVYVSTQDINSINIGDTVGLTRRQRLGDEFFYGTITGIDTTAVVRLTPLGIEERKVSVQIQPTSPPSPVYLGHALDVTFYIFREDNRIIVPRTSVFRSDGQDAVWAVLNSDNGSGVVEMVYVTTGLELRTDVIIESGLGVGDFVINDANNPNIASGRRVINES